MLLLLCSHAARSCRLIAPSEPHVSEAETAPRSASHRLPSSLCKSCLHSSTASCEAALLSLRIALWHQILLEELGFGAQKRCCNRGIILSCLVKLPGSACMLETCACCTKAHCPRPRVLPHQAILTTGILPQRLPPHLGKLPWECRACRSPLRQCPLCVCHAQGLTPAERTSKPPEIGAPLGLKSADGRASAGVRGPCRRRLSWRCSRSRQTGPAPAGAGGPCGRRRGGAHRGGGCCAGGPS